MNLIQAIILTLLAVFCNADSNCQFGCDSNCVKIIGTTISDGVLLVTISAMDCKGSDSNCDGGSGAGCSVNGVKPVSGVCIYNLTLPSPSGDPPPQCTKDAECVPSGPCSYSNCTNNQCVQTILSNGTQCRTSNGLCDYPYCNGVTSSCPVNLFQPSTVICHYAITALDGTTCDLSNNCTGTSADCPDLFMVQGTVCRPAVFAADNTTCDLNESCNGTSAYCPQDTFENSTTICRPSAGICDLNDFCNGSSNACPPNAFVPQGTPCDPAFIAPDNVIKLKTVLDLMLYVHQINFYLLEQFVVLIKISVINLKHAQVQETVLQI